MQKKKTIGNVLLILVFGMIGAFFPIMFILLFGLLWQRRINFPLFFITRELAEK